MKLLSIASSSSIGGSTFSLLHLLKGLKNKGVEIIVVVPEKGFLCDELSKLDIPYYFNPVPFVIWPFHRNLKDYILYFPRLVRTVLYNAIGYHRLKRLVLNVKPDIIHSNVSVINVGFRVAKHFGIPHVWHIREYGDRDFDMSRFPSDKKFRKELTTESYAIAITQDIFNYFGLNSNATVIYNGIEETLASNSEIKKENKFIFAGHLSDGKGTRSLIREFAKFALSDKKGYILELWGSSPKSYEDILLNEISKLAMSDRIFLKGETKNIYPIMLKAKAIIVPSKYEGFGRITAEAMINNCLVIGRDTAGTKEQFDNGLHLLGKEIAIRFKNDDEIANSLRYVAEMNDSDYYDMLHNARSTVEHLYNCKKNVDETFDFLSSL